MLEIRPITFRAACAFVAAMHRHNKAPRGHKFSIACYSDGDLCGVAMIGRPVARALDDGLTAEIIRTCTDGTEHANGMLYGAAVRCCKAMGYRSVISYTQGDETGGSLRGSGFLLDGQLAARRSWAESSIALRDIRDPIGNGGVERKRWRIDFAGRQSTL